MTTLKEETIKGLTQEGKFNMCEFGDYKKQRRSTKNCGTACCLAGHIVSAAARLGRALPKPSELTEKYDPASGSFTEPARESFQKKGLRYDDNETAMAARLVWARSYGVKSANALDFYAESPEMFDYPMSQVPPTAAIVHLNRVSAIK